MPIYVCHVSSKQIEVISCLQKGNSAHPASDQLSEEHLNIFRKNTKNIPINYKLNCKNILYRISGFKCDVKRLRFSK